MAILHIGFLNIPPVHGLLHHCISVTCVFILIYVCLLCMFWSLVALHPGNRVMHTSCILFAIPLSSSSSTYIHKSGLTYRFWISCHIHWNTYLCSKFFNISCIYFYYNFFLLFITLLECQRIKVKIRPKHLKSPKL